ncbi:MAG: TlpA disulfide reductase family protein [Bacteroidetes bacterium]|jgi:thiol-disulfide isomerase/thioredoxin|nr:TlpA disulfide reductase family protein [Bacteroidota bacterium]
MKQPMIWTLCLAVVLGVGCGEPTSSSEATAPAPTSSSANTASQAEKASSPNVQPDVTVSPKWKNGVTDANKGDKIGKVALKGTIPAEDGMMLYLYETEGRNQTLMDSATVRGRAFDFGPVEVHRGFYKLAAKDAKNNCLIVLNPDESEVNLVFRNQRMNSGKSAPQSRENSVWFTYESFSNVNNNTIRNLRKDLKDSPFKAQVEQQIADKENELVAKTHELIDANPDTYMAKFLGWKYPKYPGSQGNYFDDMDPMDNSLIRSMAISDRIQGFMVAYSKGADPGFLACIDMVKAHFEPNPQTLESALYSMLEGFYNTGDKEHICAYILDNYIYDEDCGADLSDVIRQRAQGIINLQVGKTPPNFTMNTWEGESINLMETAKANTYTLVMFWASWCHKCEQEIPVLIPVYEKYRGRGFEAIGVSLDQSRQTWVGVIEQRGMQYPNVSQLQGWDSPIVKDYKITATPTYFLLDKSGNIVLKPKRIYEVDAFLQKNL